MLNSRANRMAHEGDDDFGDDFDEFEEGAAPAGPDDDDFGEFDEGFQAPGEETTQIAPEQPAIPTTPAVCGLPERKRTSN